MNFDMFLLSYSAFLICGRLEKGFILREYEPSFHSGYICKITFCIDLTAHISLIADDC